MNFRGIFKPPAVPFLHSPMKIAGPGRLRVAREGLEIEAFQADARVKIEAALAVALFVIVAALLQFSTWPQLVHLPSIFLPMAGGVLGGLLYFAAIGGRDKHLPDRRVQIVIPWASVGEVMKGLRQPGSVVVQVKGENGPETIHFDPACGAEEVLCAMRERPVV